MERAEIDTAAAIFARSFQESALYRYFEPDAEKRRTLLRLAFQHRVECGFDIRDNFLAAIDGNTAGAALWSRPASGLPPNEALTEAVRRYNPAVSEKWRHFHAILFAALDNVCPTPHWSLAPIAVLPEFHRLGIAHTLITTQLAEIDRSCAPCMLATQDSVNIGIYQRYGFTLADSTPITKSLHNYVMIRPGAAA